MMIGKLDRRNFVGEKFELFGSKDVIDAERIVEASEGMGEAVSLLPKGILQAVRHATIGI